MMFFWELCGDVCMQLFRINIDNLQSRKSLAQSLGQSDKEQSTNLCNGPVPLSNIPMNSKYETTSHRQNQNCVSKQTLA